MSDTIEFIIMMVFVIFATYGIASFCRDLAKWIDREKEPPMTSIIGKIYIEHSDGTKFLKEEIQGGSSGFMLTDDKGNKIWVWVKEKG